ncbi:MAG: chloride channel protein [Acidimicrobiales bacterium]
MKRSLESAIKTAWATVVGSHRLVPVAVVGVVGGLAGAAYVVALRLLSDLVWSDEHSLGLQALVLLGAGAILAVAAKVAHPVGDVELLVDNIHVLGGAETARSTVPLLPLSLVSIASGAPVGPEAPLVQTTGTLGSVIARRLGVGTDELRVLTITGMAAGFTVLFGAPLGGALFALEILHRRGLQYYEALVPALVGSLCGYGVFVALTRTGLAPEWPLPSVSSLTLGDMGWTVLAALAGAALAAAFVGLQAVLRRVLAPVPKPVRPLLGAVALVGLAAWSPFALTFGHEQVPLVAGGTLAVGALVVAVVAKLAGTSVAIGTGWKGGFVIPLFFMGLALGQAFHQVMPSANAAVVVSACAVAASVGVTKTPLGSALVVTEMTGLTVLPTTILAAVVALLVTRSIGLIESQRPRASVEP